VAGRTGGELGAGLGFVVSSKYSGFRDPEAVEPPCVGAEAYRPVACVDEVWGLERANGG